MVKSILATVAALSLAIAGVGVAEKGFDRAECPGDCGFDCPGDCGVNCPGDCSPESCEGCGGRCGHGAVGVEAKRDGTDAARVSLTKFASLSTESDGEGTCPGHCGLDCPGDCGIDCPGDCTPGNCGGCSGWMCQPEGQCPANLFYGGCGGRRGGCGNGHAEPNATKKPEVATGSAVAHAANMQ